MIPCSRRRKTIYPFCSDDPKCFWNKKNCRKRPEVNTTQKNVNRQFQSYPQYNSKLNMIIQKLNMIENKLNRMTLKKYPTQKVKSPKSVKSVKSVKSTNSSKSSKSSKSTKTAKASNVNKLLKNSAFDSDKFQNSSTNSRKTASISSVNKLKRILN